MKPVYKLSMLAFVILYVCSCTKLMEYFPESKQAKNYRIRKITFLGYYNDYTGNFYYNRYGDPDSVIFDFVGTGYPNLYFIYNSRRQLIEMRGLYLGATYEDWHHFGYTGNIITTDTVYIWGDPNTEPEPGNYHDKKVRYFEYDFYGRLVKETWVYIYPSFPPMEFLYRYDAFGNRIDPNQLLHYDKKINIHQLHPLWQWVGHDYSVNNPIPAVSYNTAGLPERFDQPLDWPVKYSFLSGSRRLEQSVIEYEKYR